MVLYTFLQGSNRSKNELCPLRLIKEIRGFSMQLKNKNKTK